MIDQIHAITLSDPFSDATNSRTKMGKRRFSLLGPVRDIKSMISSKKRRIDAQSFNDSSSSFQLSFSILEGIDYPESSLSIGDSNDIFEWMETVLGERDENNGNSSLILSAKTPSSVSTTKKERNDSQTAALDENLDIDSFFSSEEADPCYEEMISLLADEEKNKEDSVLKTVRESFLSDQLLGNNSIPSRPSGMRESSAKRGSFNNSTSLSSNRFRSSRIGIREGLEKLVNANRLSATTRQMLLSCRLALPKKNSQ